MKNILLLIVLITTIAVSIQAVEYDDKTKEELKRMGVYFGNPLENKIIGSGEMYVVIHNPTALALTVMHQEAKENCRKNLGYQFTSTFWKMLGRYTTYFSCSQTNKIDQYNLPDQEKECIEITSTFNCNELNIKNAKIIDEIKLLQTNEEKYTTHDFVYSIRAKFYDQIEEFEKVAEDNRINKQIQKNIKLCKKYAFNEGSNEFNQCILTIINAIYKIDK